MKRRRGQPFLGTERHNALPTGLLAVNRFPPMPPPILAPGLRHCLVLRLCLDESYPGIQITTARKAGDSLTLTNSGKNSASDRAQPASGFHLVMLCVVFNRDSQKSATGHPQSDSQRDGQDGGNYQCDQHTDAHADKWAYNDADWNKNEALKNGTKQALVILLCPNDWNNYRCQKPRQRPQGSAPSYRSIAPSDVRTGQIRNIAEVLEC